MLTSFGTHQYSKAPLYAPLAEPFNSFKPLKIPHGIQAALTASSPSFGRRLRTMPLPAHGSMGHRPPIGKRAIEFTPPVDRNAPAAWRLRGHLLKLRLRFSIPWSVEGVKPVKCAICGKAPHYGNVVSHANNTRRRRWNPNLRRVRAVVDGVRKQIRVCTGCIRLGRVKKAA